MRNGLVYKLWKSVLFIMLVEKRGVAGNITNTVESIGWSRVMQHLEGQDKKLQVKWLNLCDEN